VVACRTLRARRVLLAIGIIWCLSMLDLVLTMAMMMTSGMIECNPLARALVHWSGSTYPLAAWKILGTLLSTVILAGLRRSWSAEAAAWICVLALGLTTISWIQYLNCEEVQFLSSCSTEPEVTPKEWIALNR
jgi:uncharacterized membrane protein